MSTPIQGSLEPDLARQKHPDAAPLRLTGGFSYADLYTVDGLRRLDETFRARVLKDDAALAARFETYRASGGTSVHGPEESTLLIDVARHLERFVAALFGVEAEAGVMHRAAADERAVMRLKKDLWRKRGAKLLEQATPSARPEMAAVLAAVAGVDVDRAEDEVTVAHAVLPLLDLEDRCAKVLAKGGAVVTDDELGRVEAWRLALLDDTTARTALGNKLDPASATEGTDAAAAQLGRVKHARALLGALLDSVARGAAALAKDSGPHALAWAKEGPQRPEEGLAHRPGWVAFRTPQPVDHHHLVHLRRPDEALPELAVGPDAGRRARDGFALTDRRMDRLEVANEADYCILCHDREKDSCRRGLIEPPPKGAAKPAPAAAKSAEKPEHPVTDPKSTGGAVITSVDKTGGVDVVDPRHSATVNPDAPVPVKIKQNPLGVPLVGCPLDERIGEMHELRRDGMSIGALALVHIDNPMCPGTGHRICNDCMKGCIYQKQDPVNIPQAETGVLTDVLHLPWGVEIYTLLTRWNPLNARRPYPAPYNGKNVLVVGMGPAGYTLAHHLINEGFGVVGIDGLKVEPLPVALVGRWSGDRQTLPEPIFSYGSFEQELDERRTVGFGGVAEYGITVRWDKNFLDLIAVALMRRSTFAMYGGVRFGGTITAEDAWSMGFDHIAVAAGAGKPTLIDVPNALARGVRQASDFLMALQLTGAYKRQSLANLQVRLPALVIGGGLTAIDTATELAAYYVVQVERTLHRMELLVAERGHEVVWRAFDDEEKEALEEMCAHGVAVREERALASKEGRAPQFQPLIDRWGGVTIGYRRTMNESPAYRLNHEEIIKCLEEGVRFAERISPKEVVIDERGAAKAMVFDRMAMKDSKLVSTGETMTLPARTICIAAGTSPNVTYEREHPGTFVMDPKTKAFKPHVIARGADGKLVAQEHELGFFTSYNDGAHCISFYGDNLPRYAGSVVKAMASAKDGFPHVAALYADELRVLDPKKQADRDARWRSLVRLCDDELVATIHDVIRLTPTIVEVIVRAPRAARAFHPGQFYRLQNFELDAPVVDGTRLVTEGMALTGAWVDREKGLLSTIILELGGSSRLCATLRKGQQVVLMGPTGAPTEIPENERVVLAGGGLGNAVLFSIGKALRARGCKVVYFAGYRNPDDVYHEDDIEQAADKVVWSCDRAPAPPARRGQDASFVGNILQSMVAYATGALGDQPFAMMEMDRIIAIGSDRMMAAVKTSRHPGGMLHPHVRPDHIGVASINSPMQCMMKEICAQCLQRHVDPKTGKVTIVFSCFNQDQEIDKVDFPFLAARLRASSAQEKLTNLWLDRLLAKGTVARI